MDPATRLTALEFQQVDGVEDWRVLAWGASAWFAAPSHAAGAELATRIAQLDETVDHVPAVDVRAGGVQVRTWSAEVSSLTGADVALARAVSASARELGLSADPSVLQTVQMTIDTARRDDTVPFWAAALGYERHELDLVDPAHRHPSIWFQHMDVPRPLRNRLHVDVGVAPDLIRGRLAAVEAAGGTAVRRSDFHVALADPEGNEIDMVPMTPETDLTDVAERADWRVLFGGMVHYRTADPMIAATLAAAVAALADEAGMALLIDLRADGITIDTGKDRWDHAHFPALAAAVQAAARELGLVADPAPLRFVQIGIDAVDVAAVRAFWKVVLGYELDERPFVTDIFDPRWLAVPVFFQPIEEDEPERRAQRNRTHIDVFVPDDQVEARIAAAVAAGGTVVYDAEAPEWWTLADPEGNEVDIAVAVGREEIWAASNPSD